MSVSKPTALYMPVEGLDITPGARMLTEAGFEVHQLTRGRIEASTPRDAVALLAGYGRVDERLLDELPTLRIVATHSAGYDMIDLEAARARGVWVCNVPDGATEEVSTHAFTLTLALLRHLPAWQRRASNGEWTEDQSILLRRPSTLTCGVIGVGRIGRRYLDLATQMFGTVIAADPFIAPEHWPSEVQQSNLDGIFHNCDVVSLHVPLTPQTANLADADRIRHMRPGAILINVSRGGLIDESALLHALDSGHLAGAGLDVLAEEPPEPKNRLLHHDRVLVTPHIAYLTKESEVDYATNPAANVVALFQQGRPHTPVLDGSG